jgi:hypothetical protein
MYIKKRSNSKQEWQGDHEGKGNKTGSHAEMGKTSIIKKGKERKQAS